MARQAFVGAGSNLGDRCALLADAMGALRASPAISRVEVSTVYETAPVGGIAQPDFLNLVAGFETTLAPEDLLALLLAIEARHGRVRTLRWGPRTLDLDLLALENETRDTPTLQLPHPRLFERAFVTVPLRELLARAAFQRSRWNAWRHRLDAATLPDEVRPFACLLPR